VIAFNVTYGVLAPDQGQSGGEIFTCDLYENGSGNGDDYHGGANYYYLHDNYDFDPLFQDRDSWLLPSYGSGTYDCYGNYHVYEAEGGSEESPNDVYDLGDDDHLGPYSEAENQPEHFWHDAPPPPPGGFTNPFWNYISLAAIPVDRSVPSIFVTYNLASMNNHLYRYEDDAWVLYPYDFGTMEMARGYLLYLDDGDDPNSSDDDEDANMDYYGYRWRQYNNNGIPNGIYDFTVGSREIWLPDEGWTRIGHVEQDGLDMYQAAYLALDPATGELRTPEEDEHAATHWLNWNWLFWDPYEDTWNTCHYTPASGEDDCTRAWSSYYVWSYSADKYLIVPQYSYLK
jgi:hypothetical protein